jgi:hypothetical protein
VIEQEEKIIGEMMDLSGDLKDEVALIIPAQDNNHRANMNMLSEVDDNIKKFQVDFPVITKSILDELCHNLSNDMLWLANIMIQQFKKNEKKLRKISFQENERRILESVDQSSEDM